MKYCCETCGKIFDTVQECEGCESKHKEEFERKERLKNEKLTRKKEVEEAYNKYVELRKKYNEDYNNKKEPKDINGIFNDILRDIIF